MLTVEVWIEGKRDVLQFEDAARVVIGRKHAADICLSNDFVSAEHAILYREGELWKLEATGTNPTFLDGKRVSDTEPVDVVHGSVIAIRSFKLRVLLDERRPITEGREVHLRKIAELEQLLYERTFQAIDFRSIAVLPDSVTAEGCGILRPSFEAAYGQTEENIKSDVNVQLLVLSRLFLRLVLEKAAEERESGLPGQRKDVELPLQVLLKDQDVETVLDQLLADIRAYWTTQVEGGRKISTAEAGREVWLQLEPKLRSLIPASRANELVREEFFRRIVNLAFALGPLEDLLELPSVTEILIVGPERIYVEIEGRLTATGDRFPSETTTRRILERAVSRAGRRIDMSQPLVDVQLQDGSRMNAVIHPLSRSGDVLSIRRFRARPYTLQDLVENATLSATLARFLAAVVHARKNLIVVGGTGSGKTTLLGSLAAQIDPAERIVLIEDTAEIRLPPEMHVVSMQTRQPNIEGKGEVTIRQLVRNALRMRPDRLVVGECRGPEVIDMLQAMNTGHPGSFTTVHANSPEEAIARLEVMTLHGIDMPLRAIRQQIAGSIDIIVQVGKLTGGGRRVLEVAEVVEYDERENRVDVVTIFSIDWDSAAPRYRFSGWLPSFIADLERLGRFKAEDCLDG